MTIPTPSDASQNTLALDNEGKCHGELVNFNNEPFFSGRQYGKEFKTIYALFTWLCTLTQLVICDK